MQRGNWGCSTAINFKPITGFSHWVFSPPLITVSSERLLPKHTHIYFWIRLKSILTVSPVVINNTNDFFRVPLFCSGSVATVFSSEWKLGCDLCRKKRLDLREAFVGQQSDSWGSLAFWGRFAPSWLSLFQQHDPNSPYCCWYWTAERLSRWCASRSCETIPEECRSRLQDKSNRMCSSAVSEAFRMFVFGLTPVAVH